MFYQNLFYIFEFVLLHEILNALQISERLAIEFYIVFYQLVAI